VFLVNALRSQSLFNKYLETAETYLKEEESRLPKENKVMPNESLVLEETTSKAKPTMVKEKKPGITTDEMLEAMDIGSEEGKGNKKIVGGENEKLLLESARELSIAIQELLKTDDGLKKPEEKPKAKQEEVSNEDKIIHRAL
jgi:hypothetical protein